MSGPSNVPEGEGDGITLRTSVSVLRPTESIGLTLRVVLLAGLPRSAWDASHTPICRVERPSMTTRTSPVSRPASAAGEPGATETTTM